MQRPKAKADARRIDDFHNDFLAYLVTRSYYNVRSYFDTYLPTYLLTDPVDGHAPHVAPTRLQANAVVEVLERLLPNVRVCNSTGGQPTQAEALVVSCRADICTIQK